MSIDLTNEVHMRFLYKLADRVSRQGAVASLELQHAGRYSNAAFGPSDGFVDDNVNKPCYAMSEEQIEQTIEDYAKAALMAKNYGFGMVTIHGGHGWLPQQFFSPVTNQRTDKWGGSAENRGRFAVASAMRSMKSADGISRWSSVSPPRSLRTGTIRRRELNTQCALTAMPISSIAPSVSTEPR